MPRKVIGMIAHPRKELGIEHRIGDRIRGLGEAPQRGGKKYYESVSDFHGWLTPSLNTNCAAVSTVFLKVTAGARLLIHLLPERTIRSHQRREIARGSVELRLETGE